jgi:hydroxymethylpyrimidine pyrophosphatase-like HAD family hydrolase
VQREIPKLDGLSFRLATSNGAVVLAPDNLTPVQVRPMAWEVVDPLLDMAALSHAPVYCITAPQNGPSGDGVPDCYVLEPGTRRWLTSWTPLQEETLQETDPETARRLPLVHVALRLPSREQARQAMDTLRQHLPAGVKLHVVGSPYGPGALAEIVPLGGKGVALTHLASSLGLPVTATAAIGDELNDCDLLDAAGYAYAVGGSALAGERPAAREVSTAAEGAVADALDDFLARLD